MTESPPDGPEDQPPALSRPPRLVLFPDEPDGSSRRGERRSRLYLVFVLIVLGAGTLWGVRAFSADAPGTRADTFTAPRSTPGAAPAARTVEGPALEVARAEVEATVATTVELDIGARDESGAVLPDTLIRFEVERGMASLNVDTARTDSSGTARVFVTLPPRPEVTVVAARMAGTDLPPVRVTVIGRVGPPQRIEKVEGDRQVTDPGGLLEGLMIRVTDGEGNPVPDVQMFFAPDPENGLVAPSRVRTDSLGRASAIWRLGTGAGVQRLNAAVAGAVVPPVTFTATALGDPAVPEVADRSEAAEAPGEDTVQAPVPEVEPPPVVVVRRSFGVGGTFVCGIGSGRAVCRGANDRGQLGSGDGGGFVGLTVGVSHACALDDSGDAMCWGANDGGQLGDGSRADRRVPVSVETELAFSVLTAGAGHTCGLASGGRAACWGRNLSGQLGDGTTADHASPALIPGDLSFRSLVAGWEHTCGLGANGDLACWGSNNRGQLGDGTQRDRPAPTPVTGSFRSVVAGSRHTCGISGERVLCWGDNTFGQLGDGSTEARSRPTEVEGLPSRPTRLAAGAVHTCALLDDGAAWCWGQNVHGQLGDATNENRSAPSRVAGGLTFASLYAGGAVTCGFTTDGDQYCWGLNQSGQLGDATRDNRASPVRVGG